MIHPLSRFSSPYLTLYTGITLLATNGLFAKSIPLDAVDITQLRSTIAALAITLYLYCWRKPSNHIAKKTLLGIYGLGILMGLHWVTFFHSMQVTSIAIGMVSLYTFPIMVVFMEAAIHKRWPHGADMVSGLLVLLGIVIMASNQMASPNAANTVMGIAWGVVSALLFASRNILQKYYFVDVPSETLMLHQVIAIGLMLLPFLGLEAIPNITINAWTKLIVLGIFTTAGAHTLLVLSYKKLPAKTVAMVSCLQPVIGATLAWILLNEQPSVYIVIGGVIVLGVAVYESLDVFK
ncbi:MAG: DMT family transporter [Pseudomonadota bacterium]